MARPKRLPPNFVRLVCAAFAGTALSVPLALGAKPPLAWALFGALLVGTLSGLEQLRQRLRAGRAFVSGLLVGAVAGLLCEQLGNQVAAGTLEAAPWLGAFGGDLAAYTALGLVAGAAPGFLSFSGPLSRDGAVGGVLGGALGGAIATVSPAWLAPALGGFCIALGFVALRRSHASARLIPMGTDGFGDSITLRQHWVTLGPAPECDLHVTDQSLAYIKPLVLTFRDGTYWVEDPAGNPGLLKVNGEQTFSQALENNDVIEVGRYRFRFELIDPKRPGPTRRGAAR
jgi:hypothetical protein